ncbi:hypothetical protein HK097_006774 [Rhizophlyctis rosea]|uniref:Uncharacterized protein n=1 Tax=Rhizophlyctis rosea TaxID=64517 RepID=A0AAD5SLZ2_9FUNG|nr:hypothetical protein HK097_006774 [Rhizophlyctis rosea]
MQAPTTSNAGSQSDKCKLPSTYPSSHAAVGYAGRKIKALEQSRRQNRYYVNHHTLNVKSQSWMKEEKQKKAWEEEKNRDFRDVEQPKQEGQSREHLAMERHAAQALRRLRAMEKKWEKNWKHSRFRDIKWDYSLCRELK